MQIIITTVWLAYAIVWIFVVQLDLIQDQNHQLRPIERFLVYTAAVLWPITAAFVIFIVPLIIFREEFLK